MNTSVFALLIKSLLFSCMLSLALSVNAAILNVSNGLLIGAQDVLVDGINYDVDFVEGSCADVFSGCDEPTDFFFVTRNEAENAAQALLDQVFIDGPQGNFDSTITSIFGCEQATVVCVGVVTYQFGLFGGEQPGGLTTDVVLYARNFEVGSSSDNVGGVTFMNTGGLIGEDTTIGSPDRRVWAVYSASSTAVPLPAAVWLFISAITGLISLRARHSLPL